MIKETKTTISLNKNEKKLLELINVAKEIVFKEGKQP